MKGWRSADEGCGRRHEQPQIQTDMFHFNLFSLYDSLGLRRETAWERKGKQT